MSPFSSPPFIVADIGGTNARFALAHHDATGGLQLSHAKNYVGAAFDAFESVFSVYRETLSGVEITSACIAIASPMRGDVVAMTNLPWAFSIAQARDDLSLDHLYVVNDFHAVALGISALAERDLQCVKPGRCEALGNRAVLGAGTGLGVAGLTYCPETKRWHAISGLGGHVNLASSDDFETALIDAARRRFGHVSAEVFLCGGGLANLYHAICDVEGTQPQAYSPEIITENGLAHKDAACEKTLASFCAFLGSVAGNLALTFGAQGGVYVAGGIVPRFVSYLQASAFVDRFSHKGIMRDYVNDIPVHVVMQGQVGLLGAAQYALCQPPDNSTML